MRKVLSILLFSFLLPIPLFSDVDRPMIAERDPGLFS